VAVLDTHPAAPYTEMQKSLVGDLPSSSGALTRFVLSMDEHAATCWHERRGDVWDGGWVRKEDEE